MLKEYQKWGVEVAEIIFKDFTEIMAFIGVD